MSYSSSAPAWRTLDEQTPPTLPIRVQFYQRNRLAGEWRFDRAFRIGHDAACDVRLDDSHVRAHHAEVYADAGGWRVRNLGDKRDTFVNGAQADDVRLGNPSTVQVGWNGPLLRISLDAAEGEPAPNGCVTMVSLPEREPPPRPARPPRPAPSPPPAVAPLPEATARYRGHGFSLPLPDGWRDQTLYTLGGPVADGIRHTILVEVDPAPEADTLDAYVDAHLRLLSLDLDGFRLLKRDMKTLADGTPAARLIFCWVPCGHRPLYQEQLFILHDQAAYKLTASFTNTSRKQLGAQVEALMLAFTPND